MREHPRLPDRHLRVAVFTVKNDMHALLVRAQLRRGFGIACHIIETEELSLVGDLSWTPESGWLTDSEANRVDPSGLDLIWWRRCNRQRGYRSDDRQDRVVSRGSADALHGLAWTGFNGLLLDDPLVIYRAENKLVQLAAARAAGLSVPATLVSKNIEDIRSFARRQGGSLVMKTVRGTHDTVLQTVQIGVDDLSDGDTFAVCPSIYQELVPGRDHLRILALGNRSIAVRIRSEQLDWRIDPQIETSSYQLDAGTRAAVTRLLALLNLRMGVLDMKIAPNGPVFLEVNPQGQFLFAQGLSGTDMIGPFAQYVADLAAHASCRRSEAHASASATP